MITSTERLLMLVVVLGLLAGCEYEFREDTGGSSVVLLSDVARVSSDPRAPEHAEPKKPTAPPDVRPVLAPGKDVSGQAAIPANAKRINMAALMEEGKVAVTTNVPGLSDVVLAFDEDDATLAKSEGINPFVFTVQFTEPLAVKAVRIRSTYSDYGWALEAQGSPRLLVDTIIDGEWSSISWPDGLKTNQIKIEVLRKARDNFVHVNEIEFYQ